MTFKNYLVLPLPGLTVCLTTCLATWSNHWSCPLILQSIFWVNYEKVKNMFWRLMFTVTFKNFLVLFDGFLNVFFYFSFTFDHFTIASFNICHAEKRTKRSRLYLLYYFTLYVVITTALGTLFCVTDVRILLGLEMHCCFHFVIRNSFSMYIHSFILENAIYIFH